MGKTKELFMEMREKINREVDSVLNGETNAFELGRELSYTKNCIEDAKEKIAESERNEFDKYTKEELKFIGVQMAGGGYTYKFDHIPEWVELKDKLKAIEDKAKEAFRNALNNSTLFDNETGAEVTPADGIPRKQSISYALKQPK